MGGDGGGGGGDNSDDNVVVVVSCRTKIAIEDGLRLPDFFSSLFPFHFEIEVFHGLSEGCC